jgi:tRNA A-37 threonylcarbamoyl transferase component Bud32
MRPADGVVCLKQESARSVWLVQRPGQVPRVLKSWRLSPLLALKMLVGMGQPQRQVRGARGTARAGIRTPAVTRGPRLVRRGWVPVIEVELDYIAGDEAWALLRRGALDESDRMRLARECGACVARYRRAGLFHRDLKLANVIVDAQDRLVWVIDTVGVRPMRRAAAETARMLERLMVQMREQGLDVSPPVSRSMLRAALRPLTPRERRAVGAALRLHESRLRRRPAGRHGKRR